MSFSLLGVHANTAIGGIADAIQRWKPPLVVILDHGDVWHQIKASAPHMVLVGRLVDSLEPNFNEPSLDPHRAARDHCEQVLPWAERMGRSYSFWLGVNEPKIQSVDAMRRMADFEAERARVMAGHGFRVLVGAFSVGNPAQLAHWQAFLPALEAARQFDGGLALHEYAWPSLHHEWPWYLLRHRKVYAGEPDHDWQGLPLHLETLPLFITECGLDGGLEAGCPPRGWRALYRLDEYLKQLAWYDGELRRDPYVMGAALYCTCSAGDPLWGSFNIWPEVLEALAREARPIYRLDQHATRPAPPAKPAPFVPPVEDPGPAKPAPLQPVQPLPPAPAPRPPAQPTPPSPRPGGGIRLPRPPAYPLADLPGASSPYAVPRPLAPGAQTIQDQVMERLDRILALCGAKDLAATHAGPQGGLWARVGAPSDKGAGAVLGEVRAVRSDSGGRAAVEKPQVLDRHGQTREWEWLVAGLGGLSVERAETPAGVTRVYRLVSLQEVEGPAALLVHVLGEDGQPLEGVRVARSWADAPPLPAWPSPVSRWRERGVHGPTDGNGNVAFGLGVADYYALPEGGPAAVWVADQAGPSDLVTGLGMLHGTNHRHVDLCWQLQPVTKPPVSSVPAAASSASASSPEVPKAAATPAAPAPPPAPPLTEDQWNTLLERLDRIIAVLEDRTQSNP